MLTNLAATQVLVQGSELVHPKIYTICERLGYVKGSVSPADPKLRISVTQASNRMTRRSPSEETVLMVSQKPKIAN